MTISLPSRTSTGSVAGGAGLLHPPDDAESAGPRTATPSQWATARAGPSGDAVTSVAATSCLLSLSAAALSKPSARHDSTTGLGGTAVSASDAALLLPPTRGGGAIGSEARSRAIAFCERNRAGRTLAIPMATNRILARDLRLARTRAQPNLATRPLER